LVRGEGWGPPVEGSGINRDLKINATKIAPVQKKKEFFARNGVFW